MKLKISAKILTLFLFLLPMLVSCAQSGQANDPFESVNRRVNSFNSTLDRVALKPATQVYVALTPDIAEKGIDNFFANANYPLVILNQFLQGKFATGLLDTARFLINTTAGVAGFIDVSSRLGIAANDEDFGQTFAVWGVEAGPFLVIPFWGPVTLRDGFGDVLDSFAFLPRYIDHVPTRNSVIALSIIDKRAGLLAAEQILSGDRYLFLRDAYLQQRQFMIVDGEVESDPFLDP